MWMREVLGGRDLSAVSCRESERESGAEAGSCEGLMGGDEVVKAPSRVSIWLLRSPQTCREEG